MRPAALVLCLFAAACGGAEEDVSFTESEDALSRRGLPDDAPMWCTASTATIRPGVCGGTGAYGFRVTAQACVDPVMCSGFFASHCALVELWRGSKKIGTGVTNENGHVDFKASTLGTGNVTVKVLNRAGKVVAQQQVAAADLDDARIELSLPYTRTDTVSRCTEISGKAKVTQCGAPVSGDDTRWSWVAKLNPKNGAPPSYSGVFFSWPEQSDTLHFQDIHAGDYTLSLLRVDLPRRNNLDYAAELRWMSASRITEVAKKSVKVTTATAAKGLDVGTIALADPRASCR